MSLQNRPPKRYRILARKWLSGRITAEEKKQFADWYNESQEEPLVVPEHKGLDEAQYRNRIFSGVMRKIDRDEEKKRIPFSRYFTAAAVLALLCGLGVYLFVGSENSGHRKVDKVTTTDHIEPGGDRAYLTLEDQTVLKLGEIPDGMVKEDGNLKIRKEQGTLIYETPGKAWIKPSYNTITTPKGGQFSVILPDGSRVWLNASSTLRFPTHFNDKTRRVKLSGEGYFEVAKLPGKPGSEGRRFIIDVDEKEEVEVFGTHFNIMAYENEGAIKTTLLEGSVSVSKKGTSHTRLLKPGEQSVYQEIKGFKIVSDFDVRESISWKNGLISFNRADIRSIMRQIERWYDVEVVYQGEIPNRLLNGGISRNSSLSDLLQVLELNDIRFRVNDRTITVIH